jgi:hypothetical protein
MQMIKENSLSEDVHVEWWHILYLKYCDSNAFLIMLLEEFFQFFILYYVICINSDTKYLNFSKHFST